MKISNYNILIVDDEKPIRDMLYNFLSDNGYNIQVASDGTEALEKLKKTIFHLVISDLTMPKMDGHQLLLLIKKLYPNTAVVMMTAHFSIDSIVSAIRNGAYDYITKPFSLDEILFKIQKILDVRNISIENELLRSQLFEKYDFSKIIGKSNAIMKVLELIKKISIAKSNILILGESGTGKELIAHAIHINSQSKQGPFLSINCGAISSNLLESELFGHKKGAFTGAHKDKVGLFQAAENGTLFLDEMGEMQLELQVKLLRAIEERKVQPVGSTEKIAFNARIISATNLKLYEEVEKGNFREDLYYRLNVVEVKIPPLRERKGDIPLLVKHFINKKNATLGLNITKVEDNVIKSLKSHNWKGNIRELENVIERAMILTETEIITIDSLPDYIEKPFQSSNIDITNDLSLKDAVANFEKDFANKLITKFNGDKTLVAKKLGISLASLYRKLS